MRIVKILLIIIFLVVAVLFGLTTVSDRLSGANVPPVIQCDSEVLEISVNDDESALLAGVTASDRQDGDLTARIRISGVSKLISDDTAKVTYVVFDSDHNMGSLTRYIRYTDYELPKFSLEEPLIYYQGESIALLDRLSATDLIDGDITESIRVSTLTATADPEIFTVSVQVTNSMGDTARLNLPVVQLGGTAKRPQVILSDYLVYIPQGSIFNPDNYLVDVELPSGKGSISAVEISGVVDTANPGTYTIYYIYHGSGNSGTSILTVVVE